MNRTDYRNLSDEGLAEVVNHELLTDVLRRTVVAHEVTIKNLTDTLDNTRAVALIELADVRSALSASEVMRAAMSDELQRLRTEFRECIEFSARCVKNDQLALQELSDDGVLNITGHNTLDEVNAWLAKYAPDL